MASNRERAWLRARQVSGLLCLAGFLVLGVAGPGSRSLVFVGVGLLALGLPLTLAWVVKWFRPPPSGSESVDVEGNDPWGLVAAEERAWDEDRRRRIERRKKRAGGPAGSGGEEPPR